MRIGVVCNKFSKSGGMETFAINLVEAIVQSGNTPVIFCKKVDISLPVYKHCEIHILPCHWLPNKLQLTIFDRLVRIARKRHPVDFMYGCCLSSSADIPFCGGTHIGFLKAMKKKPTWSDRTTIELEREQYTNCKMIVAHSKLMKNELINYYGVAENRIKVVYPFFQCPIRSEQDVSALRKKYNLPEDKVLFLFPSSSHKRKGFGLLQEVFSKSDRNICLIVAGRPIDGSYPNIQYVGYAKNIDELYHACDYSILASAYEPLGLVGPESVLNGTPTILSDACGCNEVINEAARRTFAAGNTESLATVINDVIDHPIRLSQPYSQYIESTLSKSWKEQVSILFRATISNSRSF